MITALAGGVGASKLLDGLTRAISPEEISIVVNTGDDIEMFGLYISPDLDIVTYTLADLVNEATGWGVRNDTFRSLEGLKQYGGADWFNLGDRDLATHIWRTMMLRQGHTLSQAADHIRRSLGVRSRLLPMTDSYTPTTILSDDGEMHFQEYLVRRRAQVPVRGLRFENIENAAPAPGVIQAIEESSAVIICPSNPLISIGPILAVPGIRQALHETSATVVAISPVVGGASLKGPTDQMLSDLGMEVSALQVAKLYADLLDIYVIDEADAAGSDAIRELGLEVIVTRTIMSGPEEKLALAMTTLDRLGIERSA
ncbi:MAG: 2-phospho-L-lactate transferase [Acidobacteriota bacterium]